MERRNYERMRYTANINYPDYGKRPRRVKIRVIAGRWMIER